jgi:hypothetical protein
MYRKEVTEKQVVTDFGNHLLETFYDRLNHAAVR